jgi:hypothetical protein
MMEKPLKKKTPTQLDKVGKEPLQIFQKGKTN